MEFVNWAIANWQALLSVASAALGVVVMIMHLAHKDSVAQSLQSIENTISGLVPPKSS